MQKQITEAERAYTYVCRLLTRRDYTTHEIRTKLCQKKYLGEVVDSTIAKFTELKFLNDAEYVGKYVRSRLCTRPCGQFLLTQELLKKGIPKNLIELYFTKHPIDEKKIAQELIEKHLRKLKKLAEPKRTQKALYLLRSRGLSYGHFEHIKHIVHSVHQ